jgi:predicted RNase H-like HicB family nuclease
MRAELTAVFEPRADGWIVAYVLEVPGTRTQGKTVEEARANLAELLRVTLNSYRVNLLRRAAKDATLELLPVQLPTLPSQADAALAVAAGLTARTFTERECLQALVDAGLITEIRDPRAPGAIRAEHEPIPIEGKPISEEIIEGRR